MVTGMTFFIFWYKLSVRFVSGKLIRILSDPDLQQRLSIKFWHCFLWFQANTENVRVSADDSTASQADYHPTQGGTIE